MNRMIKAQQMNEELKKIIARAESDPGSPATAGEIASIIRELDSVGAWISTSLRVLNQRLQLLKRKSDPVDPGIRQSVQQLQTEIKTMRTMVNRMQNQFR
jgi:hypothetical protein